MRRYLPCLVLLTALALTLACNRDKPKDPHHGPDSTKDEAPVRSSVCGTTLVADRREGTGPAASLPSTSTESTHFLAFGDTGTGEPSQFRVAAAMITYCQSHKCDFAIHTGDIFYPQGVGSTDDPRLKDRFEGPYAPLHLPIWLTLGNHDYYPPANPDAAVAYTQVSPSKAWHMPARYYTFVEHNIRFLAMDTSRPDAAQEKWALGVLAQNHEPWVIAFGHHPRRSDSRHGDADGPLAAFLDRVLCHRVDLLISGHDHALEVMKPRCGVHQLVTGAGGAGLYDINPTENGTFLAHTFGFVHLDVQGAVLRAQFLDDTGKQLCETTWHRDLRATAASLCVANGTCAEGCDHDPDCDQQDCRTDGRCNFACVSDRDCDGSCACDRNPLICEVRSPGTTELCACDAGCQVAPATCVADQVCDSGCPAGRDPDCKSGVETK